MMSWMMYGCASAKAEFSGIRTVEEEQPPVRTHVSPHELEQRIVARASELFFFALLHRLVPREFLFQQLAMEQLGVDSMMRHQLLMRSALGDLPSSSTTISSASRTVDARCDTTIVVRPLIAASRPSSTDFSVSVSTLDSASSSTTTAGR